MTEADPTPTPTATRYPDPALVGDAIRNAVAATELRPLGDHGLAHLVPAGWSVATFDEREHEMYPRQRCGVFRFADTDSFAAYVNRYKEEDTLAYAVDVPAAAEQQIGRAHV